VSNSDPLYYLNLVTCTDAIELADSTGGMGGMMQDLAFAIPGVDEAMGFAEIMKWVERSESS